MFHLLKQVNTKIKDLFRDFSFSFGKSFSKFNGYFTAFFFDDKKRMNVFKKLQHFWSINLPDILLFPIGLAFSAWGIAFVYTSSKIFENPINKTFISGSNIDSKIELSSFIRRFIHPKQQTSFSINNTRKISQIFPVIHEVTYV